MVKRLVQKSAPVVFVASVLTCSNAYSNDTNINDIEKALQLQPTYLTELIPVISHIYNVEITLTSEKTGPITTPNIHGNYSVTEALQLILRDSGYYYIQQGVNQFEIRRKEERNGYTLGTLYVHDRNSHENGTTRIDREHIESGTTGNANLTDVLTRTPGVSLSGDSRRSTGAGEITPDNISIHGSPFFQNRFQIDGAVINNDIDPAYDDKGDLKRLGSHSQGYFVNLKNIESIEIMDHNISAQYGGFTGGVVDAQSRKYSGNDSFWVTWRHTSDSLTSFHVDPSMASEFEQGSIPSGKSFTLNQPRFTKNFFDLGGDLGHTDNIGTNFSIFHKKSEIPLYDYQPFIYEVIDGQLTESIDENPNIDQYRESIGFNTKTTITIDDFSEVDLNLRYNTNKSRMSLGGHSNSSFDYFNDAMGAGLNYQSELSIGNLFLKTNWDTFKNERTINTQNPELLVILRGDQNITTGVPGPMSQSQNTYSLNPHIELNSIEYGSLTNNIRFGFDISKTDLEEIRSEKSTEYTWACLPWGSVCSSADQLYLFSRYQRLPYDINVTQNQYGFWAENKMEYNQFSINPGLRIDHNSFLGNTNFSPRFNISYDIFGDNRTNIYAGANRYYGRSFLELQAAQLRDKYTYSETWPLPNIMPDFKTESRGTTNWDGLLNVKTPYNNEFSIGASHILGNWQHNLAFVTRQGRDQFSYIYDSETRQNRFGNRGTSDTQTLTLTSALHKPIHFANANWTPRFMIEWQETLTNARNLNPGSNSGYLEGVGNDGFGVDRTDRVILDGRVIDVNDLPANAFNIPWRSSIQLAVDVPQYNLNINNFFDIKAGHNAIESTSPNRAIDPNTGEMLYSYEKVSYSKRLNWDMNIRWSPALGKSQPYVQLDILNVLNDSNVSKATGGTRYYDTGRQFWIETGIQF